MSNKSTFIVSNLDCSEEIALIEKTLRSVHGIKDVSCNIFSQKVEVVHSKKVSEKRIGELLTSAGLKLADNAKRPQTDKSSSYKGLLLSGMCLVSGYLLDWSLETETFSIFLFVATTIIGGWKIVPKAVAAVQRLSPDMNLLMTVAVLGAFMIGEYAEGATVTFLFALSEWLESFSVIRARNAIKKLMELAPQTARVFEEGVVQEIPVEEVAPGSLVHVRSGERIPLDGIVENGESSVNQAPITGESIPILKQIGKEVFAGSINGEGYLEVRTSKGHNDTMLSRIIHLVEEAQSEKAPTQRFVEKFARVYTPTVLVIAVCIVVIPLIVGAGSFTEWFYRALVLLVIACPCALVIATPVAIVSGLTALARRGVLVKGGSYLEELGRLQALAVDKTGTITQGTPSVTKVYVFNEVSETELVQIATSVNSNSTHPMAEAIGRYADKLAIQPKPTTNYQSVTGRGAKAEIDECQYFVGNHRFVHEIDVCSPEVEVELEKIESEGQSVVIVGHVPHGECQGEVLGILGVSDPIREDAKRALEMLHKAGISEIVMLSGDNQRTVDVISKQAGIDTAKGDLLPEDKVKEIQSLKKLYLSVGMIGDGVNDAPALALASIGIAMGVAGTDTAMETADVALMRDDLTQLSAAVSIGSKTLDIIRTNIALALGVKALFLILAVFGLTSLWLAILADTGTTLIVILNALRLLKDTSVNVA